jgi:hypothetical protein
MITADQKAYVREAIIDVSSVQFQDFYEEMNDHYLSSIEAQIAEGKDFEAAFVVVHSSFLDYQYTQHHWFGHCAFFYGLRAMEMEYLHKMSENINQRHRVIVKNYFRWPTLMVTILVGVLTYLLTDLVSYNQKTISWVQFSLILPTLIMIPISLKIVYERLRSKRQLVNSVRGTLLANKAFLLYNIWNITNLSKHLFGYDIYTKASIPFLASFLFVSLV